jgi:hypothetical protein
MSNWIAYIVGFSQIIVLHFLALPYGLRLTYSVYLGKNRQWVTDKPEFRERYPLPKWSVWLSFLLGAGLCAYFLREIMHVDGDQRVLLLNLFNWPIASFSAVYSAHAIIECFRVRRKIPLPAKRRVVLERRSLQSIVNPKWVSVAYLLVVVVVGAYVFAHYAGVIDTHVFVKRTLDMAVLSLASSLALAFGVLRKKQSVDEWWGPAYRKSEVVFGVACLYLVAGFGALSFLQDVFEVTLFTYIGVQITLSAFIQAGMFYMGRHSWPKNPWPPRGSLTSAQS